MSAKVIHHICIQTSCYEQSLAFYRDALGFEVVQETPGFHTRGYNSWLRLGEFYIELQTGKAGEELQPVNTSSRGIVHFCLWVEDLEEEVRSLKESGAEFRLKNGREIYTVENGKLCKLTAPEGTIIELRDTKGI
ncbi:VOC family protein [Paenibacillus sp. 1P03SA]|uniref:VOC family protein n=1 Tax=Paenibacillus sp. 1P03SA TaxID=3132294 RepID=UPI0039A3200D